MQIVEIASRLVLVAEVALVVADLDFWEREEGGLSRCRRTWLGAEGGQHRERGRVVAVHHGVARVDRVLIAAEVVRDHRLRLLEEHLVVEHSFHVRLV